MPNFIPFKKNKILHIITSLNLGGAEGVLTRLVTFELENLDHVVISLTKSGYYEDLLKNNGIKVYSLDFRRGIGSLLEFYKLLHAITIEKPNLIQTWLYHADFIGVIAAKLLGYKNIAWGIRTSKITASISNVFILRLLWLLAHISRFSPSGIACCSIAAMNEHVRIGYDKSKFTIIPNGYDPNKFYFKNEARDKLRSIWGLDNSNILLGCIARWDPFKDHENLFRAMALIKRDKRVRFLLMGEFINYKNNKLMSLIKKYQLEDILIIADVKQDVVEVMSSLDFHILPSRSEGFPNVLAESMLCEIPVISTDVGDSRLIVGKCGWIVPSASPMFLAGAIKSAILLFNSAEYTELKTQSRKRIVENFPLSKMANEFNEFWQLILAKKAYGKNS